MNFIKTRVTKIKNRGQTKNSVLSFQDLVTVSVKCSLIRNCIAALRYSSYLTVNTSCENHEVFNRAPR